MLFFIFLYKLTVSLQFLRLGDFLSQIMASWIKKRKVLPIIDNVSVIRTQESGRKIADVHHVFGLVNSTVDSILKCKDKFSKLWECWRKT